MAKRSVQLRVALDPRPDAASLTEWLVTLSTGGGVFVTVIAGLKES